jgi:hypothetical protein
MFARNGRCRCEISGDANCFSDFGISVLWGLGLWQRVTWFFSMAGSFGHVPCAANQRPAFVLVLEDPISHPVR